MQWCSEDDRTTSGNTVSFWHKIIDSRNEDLDGIEKNLFLTNFHLIYEDGNFKIATGQRGDYYLIFRYATS
ncbi:unnamed protein product, partial [Mesorhabditis belari]|uniref:Uncharacterized protein n=1 Tax=Mesorhabditis belari TaxID=2138241 RepID=A0AAF3F9R6_9BILA